MSVEFEPEIEWDGTSLSRWAVIRGNRIHIRLLREMIHSIPIYNDAIGWEIERYKADIFERLKPKLLADLNVDVNERVGRLSCLVTHIASD
jgi:hypothetical protein